MKIGMIGSTDTFFSQELRPILKKLKDNYGVSIEICTGGNRVGIENDIRKLVLELGFQYKEFNPANTPRNGYSAYEDSYYGRPWHPTHAIGRYRKLVQYCDAIFAFHQNDELIASTVKYGKKIGKKVIEITK